MTQVRGFDCGGRYCLPFTKLERGYQVLVMADAIDGVEQMEDSCMIFIHRKFGSELYVEVKESFEQIKRAITGLDYELASKDKEVSP